MFVWVVNGYHNTNQRYSVQITADKLMLNIQNRKNNEPLINSDALPIISCSSAILYQLNLDRLYR